VVLVATTLVGVLVVVNQHMRASAVNAIAAGDTGLVAHLLRTTLRDGDLEARAESARRTEIDLALLEFADEHGLLGLVIRDQAGRTVFGASHDPAASSMTPSTLASFRAGEVSVVVLERQSLLIEHLPVVSAAGSSLGIVSIERDGTGVLAAAASATRDVVLIFAVGAVLLASILVLTFRGAQQLLNRRTAELVESTRRDRLTGLLNHGTALTELADTLETARERGGWVVVALIDVDGFRLVNETHGYDAGDRVLRLVAELLRACAPPRAVIARCGPDEFLLIAPPDCAPDLRPSIETLRTRLAGTVVRFDGADPLTVTVSVGAASYPEHAASVSELLAVAGVMLADARTGGGNRVRVDAPERGAAPGRWSAFSVLEGLVVAVDAKDRYTRLHSEQVSRYADLLASRLDIDPRERTLIRQAALLHDVGKIGVPDTILRKPGSLTDEERTVIEQHAVMGHAILMSLTGMDDIALAVRQHHERWDGTGYPDRLAGEAISRASRVLSLADVYSALTTARPYRDAMTVDAALDLIRRGSGTQFDPVLAAEFLAAIRALPTGELPFADGASELSMERTRWEAA
jgi:diguanylate cyclase (GGDEF)-like protein/putative nucleotidyltransferase with HDIG domain